MTDISQSETREIIERLIHNIRDIKFGSVTIIIQDGKIVQIERNEKVRLR